MLQFLPWTILLMNCVKEMKPTGYRMTWPPVIADLTSASTFLSESCGMIIAFLLYLSFSTLVVYE